jgi:hypothetical protein
VGVVGSCRNWVGTVGIIAFVVRERNLVARLPSREVLQIVRVVTELSHGHESKDALYITNGLNSVNSPATSREVAHHITQETSRV